VLSTGWSPSQYWVKRGLLRCNAGIFLSVVTVLIFRIFEGGGEQITTRVIKYPYCSWPLLHIPVSALLYTLTTPPSTSDLKNLHSIFYSLLEPIPAHCANGPLCRVPQIKKICTAVFYGTHDPFHTYEHDDSLRSIDCGCAGLCAVCVHNRTHCLCDTVFTLGQITL